MCHSIICASKAHTYDYYLVSISNLLKYIQQNVTRVFHAVTFFFLLNFEPAFFSLSIVKKH